MADDAWYYAQGGHQLGPVPIDRLRAMLAAGEVRRADLVWTDGMGDWLPAGDLAVLEPPRPPLGGVAPAPVPPPVSEFAAGPTVVASEPQVLPGGPPPVNAPMGYYGPTLGGVYKPQGTAITSLVCGIVPFVLCFVPYLNLLSWIGAICAIVFGFMARTRIAQGSESGGGMALAGIILGFVFLLLVVVLIVIAIIFGLAIAGAGAAGAAGAGR